MSQREKNLYPSRWLYRLNHIALPLKLAVPQPVIKKMPFLTSNKDIRIRIVLNEVSGRLLDIGCGENDLVQLYRRSGGEGVGTDCYPWKGVDLVIENTADLPFDDKVFDTITFVACLNHIPNRSAVLKEARRLLKDDGKLVATILTPAISRVWHAVAFWDRDQKERGMKAGEVWGFTHAEMLDLLTGAGFRLETHERFSWGLNSLYICRKDKA